MAGCGSKCKAGKFASRLVPEEIKVNGFKFGGWLSIMRDERCGHV